jgi:hypothetical protein
MFFDRGFKPRRREIGVGLEPTAGIGERERERRRNTRKGKEG